MGSARDVVRAQRQCSLAVCWIDLEVFVSQHGLGIKAQHAVPQPFQAQKTTTHFRTDNNNRKEGVNNNQKEKEPHITTMSNTGKKEIEWGGEEIEWGGEDIEVEKQATLPKQRARTRTPGTIMVPTAARRSGASNGGVPRFKDQTQSMIGDNNESTLSDISASHATSTTRSSRKPLLVVPRQRQQPIEIVHRPSADDNATPPRQDHHAENAYMVPEAVEVNEEVTIPLADAVPDPNSGSKEQPPSSCRVRRIILLTPLILTGVIVAGILLWLRTPTPTFAAFTTQDELYAAVDLYFDPTAEEKDNITTVYGDIHQWDVSRVTNFSHVFSRLRNENVATTTTDLTIDLSQWDVSSGEDFSFFFFGTQWLSSDTNLSAWNTARATSMRSMFHQATTFNGDVTTWNTAQVTSMFRMFSDVRGFNQDIRNWDVFSVKTFKWMFFDNVAFDQDLSDWDTRNGEDFSYMFRGATSFNSDLSRWVTRRAYRFEEMFRDATSFNQDISQWIFAKNVSSAEFNMTVMFSGATSFYQSLCDWRTQVPTAALVTDMFRDASRCASMEDPVVVSGDQWEGPFCQLCGSS